MSKCMSIQENRAYDLIDICAMMSQAYEETFTSKTIGVGFQRAGIWSRDAKRLLNYPIPANGSSASKLLTFDELEEMYEAKRKAYRTRLMGGDPMMLQNGFVDTTNGFVMTSATVLDLVKRKKDQDAHKFRVEEQKRKERFEKEERPRLAVVPLAKRVRDDRVRRQAKLAIMSLAEFLMGRRTLIERRLVAKRRTQAKRNGV